MILVLYLYQTISHGNALRQFIESVKITSMIERIKSHFIFTTTYTAIFHSKHAKQYFC